MEGGVCLIEEVTWEPSRDSARGEEGVWSVDEDGRSSGLLACAVEGLLGKEVRW